jgi:hypothetical protein
MTSGNSCLSELWARMPMVNGALQACVRSDGT